MSYSHFAKLKEKNGQSCIVLSGKGFFGGGGGAMDTYPHQKLADEPKAEPFLLQGSINVLVPNCACR